MSKHSKVMLRVESNKLDRLVQQRSSLLVVQIFLSINEVIVDTTPFISLMFSTIWLR